MPWCFDASPRILPGKICPVCTRPVFSRRAPSSAEILPAGFTGRYSLAKVNSRPRRQQQLKRKPERHDDAQCGWMMVRQQHAHEPALGHALHPYADLRDERSQFSAAPMRGSFLRRSAGGRESSRCLPLFKCELAPKECAQSVPGLCPEMSVLSV